MEQVRVFNNKENIKYTWKHKVAFLKVEKIILGKNTLRGYLHDVDKLFMYVLLSKKLASKMHRKYSHHHIDKAKTEEDFIQMMIDWECARFTKEDKPLNAYDTLYKYYPQIESIMIPLMEKYQIKEKMKSIHKL